MSVGHDPALDVAACVAVRWLREILSGAGLARVWDDLTDDELRHRILAYAKERGPAFTAEADLFAWMESRYRGWFRTLLEGDDWSTLTERTPGGEILVRVAELPMHEAQTYLVVPILLVERPDGWRVIKTGCEVEPAIA